MGQGLSKNSPVQLSLGKENYEALIERHGQWTRWRVATKCPCVKPATQQPDIHCEKCGGLGITFGYQKSAIVSQTVMIRDNSGIIELDSEYTNRDLWRVYDNSGREYENAVKQGAFVILNSRVLPCKGVYVTAVMIKDTVSILENVRLVSQGNGWYRADGLRVSRTKTEGLFHTAPCDIVKISGIKDSLGLEYSAKEFRLDCVYIEPAAIRSVDDDGEMIDEKIQLPEILTAEKIEYIPPFVFAILNQNLSKSDSQVMQENNGDAVLTFPYAYDVAQDDIITVLSGTYTQKSVIARKNAEYDVIPAYFVEEITQCVGKTREYKKDEDFILCGANYLKWICEDAPQVGEAYSISFKVFPTYKVVKSIPQIRTSENQRMPKKAVIKLYDTFGEKRKVNAQ